MNKMYVCVVLCLTFFHLSGCATTAAYVGGDCFDPKCKQYRYDNWFYPAIKTDVQWLTQPKNPEANPVLKAFGYTAIILDFPISLAFDTIFLPFKAAGHYLSPKPVADSTRPTETKEPSYNKYIK